MVGYLFLGVCLLIALILGGRVLLTIDPAKLANILRVAVVSLGVAAAIFLMVTGRFAIGAGVAFFTLGLLRRWSFPHFSLPNLGRKTSKQKSTVDTDFLRMVLEHDSGVMAGEVLKGTYAGRDLAALNLNQLLTVLAECERADPEAAQLLETYLDRTQGDWREEATGTDGGSAHSSTGRGWGKRESAKNPNSLMTVAEAREILGVDDGASAQDIKDAHRRLMVKNHPDTGGSDFLAAKINQAKDILLGL